MYFLETRCCLVFQIFNDRCPCDDTTLVQIITCYASNWTIYDAVHWRIYASQGFNELSKHIMTQMTMDINSLWTSDAIWKPRSESILAQAMACCPVAWQHQAITWTSVDWSSVKSSDIHIWAISQEMSQSSITKICLTITCLKCYSNSPGANKLNVWSVFLRVDIHSERYVGNIAHININSIALPMHRRFDCSMRVLFDRRTAPVYVISLHWTGASHVTRLIKANIYMYHWTTHCRGTKWNWSLLSPR